MRINPLPPAEYLRECFFFDDSAGLLIWKVRPLEHFKSVISQGVCNSQRAGKPAGHLRKDGYLDVCVAGKLCLNHRIIYKVETGVDPVDEIDHINGIKADNRLCNLREASRSENCRNSRVRKNKLNRTKGVFSLPNGTFISAIRSKNRLNHIGTYPTLEEAKAAYDETAKELHGEFFHP